MTLGDQLRRHVRQAIAAARQRAGHRAKGVRVVGSANVVVARNIDAQGASRGASAHQRVLVRNGSLQQRTERTAVGDVADGGQGKERHQP